MIPAVASDGQREPDRWSRGRGRRAGAATTAAPSARADRSRPPVPEREQGDRTPSRRPGRTLGSVRASSTKPDDPDRAHGVQPAAAHPAPAGQHEQEPDHQREVGARDGQQVRQAGGPEVLGELGVEPAVVAVDQRGHQRPLARRTVRDRVADRLADGARRRATTRPARRPPGDPRVPRPAPRSPGRRRRKQAGERGRVLPSSTSSQDGPASTSTGAPRSWTDPRAVTRSYVAAEQRPVAVPSLDQPRVGRHLEVERRDRGRSRASSATGLVGHAVRPERRTPEHCREHQQDADAGQQAGAEPPPQERPGPRSLPRARPP